MSATADERCERCDHEAWRHAFHGMVLDERAAGGARAVLGACLYCDCPWFVLSEGGTEW